MKTRSKRSKRKTHRRKTYKAGGTLESNKTHCNKKAPIKEFQELYNAVDTKKYDRGFSTYSGSGCDLFIWVNSKDLTKKSKDPHIHVHGFTNNMFSYTISGLEIRNKKVELPAQTTEGYKHVLDEMCSSLTKGEHRPTSKLFTSPERTISIVESSQLRTNKPRPGKLGLGSDIFKDVSVKLGPIMGSVLEG
jgi:hypothetical protein